MLVPPWVYREAAHTQDNMYIYVGQCVPAENMAG